MTMNSTVLTARQPALRALLDAVAANPGASKADLTRGLPNKTRAGHYAKLDQLIKLGLVENRGTGVAYALHVTAAGAAEAAR